jgi:hypothetical protein
MFQQDSELGPTLGVGLQLGLGGDTRLHFDYAWGEHTYLEETHRMTLVLDF